MDYQKLEQDIYSAYSEFQTTADFTTDLITDINERANSILPEVTLAGKSIENREISKLKLGNGDAKVMVWSQMHGNEKTSSKALFDVINFLCGKFGFDGFIDLLLSKITFVFVPVLNPDGAVKNQRRNAAGIDINRDALRLASPEAKALHKVWEEEKPDFAISLHDQAPHYHVGNSAMPTCIALLAQSADKAKTIPPERIKAMQLCMEMYNSISSFVFQQVAKYDDTFDERCFGDYLQKNGTSTVLIEAGFYKSDYERLIPRKMMFLSMLSAFNTIANNNFKKDVSAYDAIPHNQRGLYDLIIRRANMLINGKLLTVDIAINNNCVDFEDEQPSRFSSRIMEIGDLSHAFAYHELNVKKELFIEEGKIASEPITAPNDFMTKMQEGITCYVDSAEEPADHQIFDVFRSNEPAATTIKPGLPANFLLTKRNKVIYSVVKGKLYQLVKG